MSRIQDPSLTLAMTSLLNSLITWIPTENKSIARRVHQNINKKKGVFRLFVPTYEKITTRLHKVGTM